MKETGIIMSGNHPKLILDGVKTMTRRVIKPNLEAKLCKNSDIVRYCNTRYRDTYMFEVWHPVNKNTPLPLMIRCPYGQVGDRLWVKHRYDLFDVYYKPIGGFEDFYATGTDGHIYRVDKGEPTILQEDPTGDKGYLAVTLSKPGHRHTHFVHRLIAKTFYGLPSIELYQDQTRHLDGNNQNNHPSNLDWGTQEDNWADRKFHGRKMGEEHHSSKLTTAQVIIIRQSSLSQRQLAHIYGVSQPTIQAVLSGKFWQDAKIQPPRNYPQWQGWKSPLFMPRWASRITLEIIEVRVERLQEISTKDKKLMAEGIPLICYSNNRTDWTEMAYQFSLLWDSINAKRGYGWDKNPWVWVIGFKRVEAKQ